MLIVDAHCYVLWEMSDTLPAMIPELNFVFWHFVKEKFILLKNLISVVFFFAEMYFSNYWYSY